MRTLFNFQHFQQQQQQQQQTILTFFKGMDQSRPLFVYFRSFYIPIQMTNIQFEQYKLKKA